jgi:hypothetical protein
LIMKTKHLWIVTLHFIHFMELVAQRMRQFSTPWKVKSCHPNNSNWVEMSNESYKWIWMLYEVIAWASFSRSTTNSRGGK